jgi:hypothetical protein
MIMGATHFSGPVYSKGGFAGQIDNTTGALATGPTFVRPNPNTINTAGAATYTAAQVLNGMLLRDANGANRTDALPTAAALVAALNGIGVATVYTKVAQVGTEIPFMIMNTAGGAFTVQITMGTGGTSGTANVLSAISQSTSKNYRIILTNVTPGAEAYTVYA